jgi:hypothetical protein
VIPNPTVRPPCGEGIAQRRHGEVQIKSQRVVEGGRKERSSGMKKNDMRVRNYTGNEEICQIEPSRQEYDPEKVNLASTQQYGVERLRRTGKTSITTTQSS